jgi:hypothetical protein
MYVSNEVALPRFASLPDALAAPSSHRSWFSGFWMAPFRDVDDRVARLAAGKLAEKAAARDAAMNAAPHRF